VRSIENAVRPSPAWMGLALFLAVSLLLGGLYCSTASTSITWRNHGADSGDLAAAVAVWGVPHPSGYPTYVLMGRLFLLLPLGEPASCLALLSVVAMAAAGGVLALCVTFALPGKRRTRLLAGLLSGLAFGLGPIPWSQAVIVEVHGLNALFVVLVLGLVIFWERQRKWAIPTCMLLGLLNGLALGNHLTFVMVLPIVVYCCWRRFPPPRWRWLGLWTICVLLGLSVYIYLPLAACARPPVNWGDACTWAGFTWVVGGGTYGGLMFGLPLAEAPGRVAAWGKMLLQQLGMLGAGLAVLGLICGRVGEPWLKKAFLWLVVCYSAFSIGYQTADSSVYLIPAWIGLSVCMGLGMGAIMSRLDRARNGLGVLVPVLCCLALGMQAANTLQKVDVRADEQAMVYASRLLEEAPPDAFVLTTSDEDTFPLWYSLYALEKRQDVCVVVVPLTQFPWYRRVLAGSCAGIQMPPYADADDVWAWSEMLLASNNRAVCRTEVQRGVEKSQVDFSCREAPEIANEGSSSSGWRRGLGAPGGWKWAQW
jgi:hypothetical protein